MTFAADSIIEYLGLGPSDRVLCTSPMSFDYGLYQLLMCVRIGATVVLEHGFAFPGKIVQLLERERIPGCRECPRCSPCSPACAGSPSASCRTCGS
jgi:acyl-CoA synthetase (AMP-forming)/AMP-acid ligase II